MKLAQRKIKWLARLMLLLVLFAQGMVAANACVTPNAGPVQAFKVVHQSDEAMPCHMGKVHNANACLVHCTQSDQISADQHDMPVAIPVNVIVRVISQPLIEYSHPIIFSEHRVLDTGPPIPIRFCSFLN